MAHKVNEAHFRLGKICHFTYDYIQNLKLDKEMKRKQGSIWKSLQKVALSTLLFTGVGCSSPSPSQKVFSVQEVKGRNDYPVYRLKIPPQWEMAETSSAISLKDTTQPLCSWTRQAEEGALRITLHNFPSPSMEARIPPQAQIERWKRQLTPLDPAQTMVTPQAFSGFTGFLFEGSGKHKEEEIRMMAWVMQLAPEHWNRLEVYQEILHPVQKEYLDQMRADFTFKIMGPPAAVARHHQEILAAARSIELIQDLLNDER